MPLPPPAAAPKPLLPALVLAAALLGGLSAAGWQVVQQVRMAPSAVPSSMAAAPKSGARDARTASALSEPSGPAWSELNTPQKLALYPLAERWATMGEAQKRRWLALAQSFAALPRDEQEKLHSRMTDWASLSAQQRSQARLNYAVTKRLAPDNKRAQWEAYQALSEEERNLLAARAARPSGAATALRPVSPKKLARVPAATAAPGTTPNLPKIPPVVDAHPRPALPVPQPAAPLETRPAATPTVVETAPVAVPSAVPAPLPPLTPPSAAEAAAPQVEPPPTPNPNPYPQR